MAAPGRHLFFLLGLGGAPLPLAAAPGAGERASAAAGAHPDLVFLNTTRGTALLKGASHDRPFWQLSPHFATENPGQCGPTTAAMILNALTAQGLQAAVSSEYSAITPYFNMTERYWEQRGCPEATSTFPWRPCRAGNVWGEEAGGEHPAAVACVRQATEDWQGTLKQVTAFFTCRGLEVEVAAPVPSKDTFRQALLVAFSKEPLRFVAVNFDRRALSQLGFGHHSPVGAYDAETDRVLVMDVARYKYPPTWVPLGDLVTAMNTTGSDGTPRGFIVVGMPTARVALV
jgi:hypothetical protein